MKRIISAFLAAVLLTALLLSLAVSAYAADDEGTLSYRTLDIISGKYWSIGEGAAGMTEESSDSGTYLSFAAISGAESVSFSATFSPVDLTGYNELAIDISTSGASAEVEYTVTFKNESTSVPYTATVSSLRTVLYVPLPASVAKNLSGITVSAASANRAATDVSVYSVTADTGYSYAFLKQFSSLHISSDMKSEINDSTVAVYPVNGACDLTFIFTEVFTSSDEVLSWISFSGTDSGSIRASVTYDDGTVDEIAPQPISRNGKYAFLSRGGFESLTVHFEGMPSGSSVITVYEAGVFKMGPARKTVGSISSCKYDGKQITVSGSINNDASIKYNGSRLLLYAIPVKDADSADLSYYVPCATSDFSTKFKISATTEKNHCEYFYRVVLDTKDGLLPVGDVHAPASGTSAVVSSSVSALHGADAADVFDSNVSTVILDVIMSELIETENTYSALAYTRDKTYYFDKSYLSELDDSIRFYDAAGVEVYLRVYSDSEGGDFDYTAYNVESFSAMSAAAAFLTGRYSSTRGFIIGESVNSMMGELSAHKAADVARTVSVFTESVKSEKADASVIVSFGASDSADPFLACSMFSYFLSMYKSGAVVSMYETSTGELLAPVNASRLSTIATYFSAPSAGTAILWNAPESYRVDDLCAVYRALCVSATAHGMKFAALSVSNTTKSPSLYAALKDMLNNEGVIPETSVKYEASLEQTSFKSTYGLWDFTDSYDTANWVSGGSFSAPFTAKGEAGGRVLMAQNTGASDGSGILICRAEPSLDLSGLSARFTLSVSSETAKSADVSIIFGSGDSRAEFTASVLCNAETALVCDMSEFAGAGKIDYASVIIRGGVDADVRVSKVEMCSDTLDSEALEARFYKESADIHRPILYAALVFIAAGTVAVFSALAKKRRRVRKGERNE